MSFCRQNNSRKPSSPRIPLVLTFHPLSERIKRILLSNFKILSGDPHTKEIFPQPPLVAHRRDRNVRDTLVHTADRSPTRSARGNFSLHTQPLPYMRLHFSRQHPAGSPMRNYHQGPGICHLLRRCSAVYIGETGRTLRERSGVHLRSFEKGLPGFPVAEHFYSNGHALQDACSAMEINNANARKCAQFLSWAPVSRTV